MAGIIGCVFIDRMQYERYKAGIVDKIFYLLLKTVDGTHRKGGFVLW